MDTILTSQVGYQVCYNCETHLIDVKMPNKVWKQEQEYHASVTIKIEEREYVIGLNEARVIEVNKVKDGLGEGIRTRYKGWSIGGKDIQLVLETYIWIDNTVGNLHLELIPFIEEEQIVHVMWPAPFELYESKDSAYSVIPMMQGCLVPSSWKKKVKIIKSEKSIYMPWWGQIDEGEGYIAIVETPWNVRYEIEHEQEGTTAIRVKWEDSLGKLGYSRKISYYFIKQGDYNTLCKIYRRYIKEKGNLITLTQKSITSPYLNELIGSAIVHTCAHVHIQPKSMYYNQQEVEKNDYYSSFEEIGEKLKGLKKIGIENVYLHLDGWGRRGYDNLHPDILPPSESCGGWEGMRQLGEVCKQLGYLFGIHDQYRDYYMDSRDYNLEHALRKCDKTYPIEDIWYGGEHTLLCAQIAPYYVERNYNKLIEENVMIKGSYLDVFSADSLDQCYSPSHPMSKRECIEKRKECFAFIRSKGLLVSSEELVDWAIPSLELCHHAPYALEPNQDNGECIGLPVPLLNLVYHDCVVIPWENTKGAWGIPKGQHGFLHALLNGGITYIGFEPTSEQVEMCKLIKYFHTKVASCEMLKHEYVKGDIQKQKTYFADGSVVTVDFERDTYEVIIEGVTYTGTTK